MDLNFNHPLKNSIGDRYFGLMRQHIILLSCLTLKNTLMNCQHQYFCRYSVSCFHELVNDFLTRPTLRQFPKTNQLKENLTFDQGHHNHLGILLKEVQEKTQIGMETALIVLLTKKGGLVQDTSGQVNMKVRIAIFFLVYFKFPEMSD